MVLHLERRGRSAGTMALEIPLGLLDVLQRCADLVEEEGEALF
jgi:hypothetical protein